MSTESACPSGPTSAITASANRFKQAARPDAPIATHWACAARKAVVIDAMSSGEVTGIS
ncbi:MAG: hypothetical protein CM15mP74_30240 [Halieaceae bacterium]|nr:MAG: hypothetical protein CM15mP74_30240 [Halieaceae bacterium]